MRKVLDRKCARCSDGKIRHASSNRALGTRDSSVQPSLTKSFFLRYVFLAALFAAKCCRPISAASNITVQSTSFNCSSNFICLGSVHAANGNSTYAGLSLLTEDLIDGDAGLAYYNEPVRLKDSGTGQSASFKTSFTINKVCGASNGEGFTFVISADNQTVGSSGGYLGIFRPSIFPCIVVEFDSSFNRDLDDIDDNHVSLDFNNITWTASESAYNVDVELGDPNTVFAWVEYGSQTQQLEVRISNQSSRPVTALLIYSVDLFDKVEEYMWVGFSAASGMNPTNYFVGNWTFESSTIPPSSPVPSIDSIPGRVGLIIGLSVGVVVLLLACVFTVALVHRRIQERTSEKKI